MGSNLGTAEAEVLPVDRRVGSVGVDDSVGGGDVVAGPAEDHTARWLVEGFESVVVLAGVLAASDVAKQRCEP